MQETERTNPLRPARRVDPATALWRLAPTRAGDGRSVADFMMLIPGLGACPQTVRDQVADRIRAVCAGYGEQVVFADVNYAINVLWVSVIAEPGLTGRVAQSIRAEVPQALLVGGQLGAVNGALSARDGRTALWQRFRRLSRRLGGLIEGPGGR
ncbi:MAG: hypothetical protein KDI82_11830 [Gammaproteobacteria bacterium]|nr:hypothetical protein [Gammaproteobacteria bacterium]